MHLLDRERRKIFNPLPSSEGRHGDTDYQILRGDFSIHFPHPREDLSYWQDFSVPHFSIHFPHPREDIFWFRNRIISNIFQSTSLIRGKTDTSDGSIIYTGFSIHFPHPREDASVAVVCRIRCGFFNPLPSSEGRQKFRYGQILRKDFQSTSLIRGKTLLAKLSAAGDVFSIHFPHPREDSKTSWFFSQIQIYF